jgi:hypothetical protein
MTYLLRDIEPRLWRDVKTRAEREGHSIRWVLLQLLTRYVHHGL